MVWKCICCCNSPKSVLRPCAILCHPKPNSLTVSENAQIRFILRFILLFSIKISYCSMLFQRAVDSPQTSGRFSLNERSIQPQRAVDSTPSNGQFPKGVKPCLLYAPVHEDFPSFSFPGTHKFRKDVLSHAGYRTHILS